MTRTTDEFNQERWQPLGKPIPKPVASPPAPEWKQVPGAAKGVGVGSDGKLSTRIPGNGYPDWLWGCLP